MPACAQAGDRALKPRRTLTKRFAEERAQDLLDAKGVRVMTAWQAELQAQLRRHWDAFVLLFNPSYNL